MPTDFWVLSVPLRIDCESVPLTLLYLVISFILNRTPPAIVFLLRCRYKNDLNAALDRESGLERSKAQLDLDWQRRYDNVERQQFEKSEQYIQKLSDAKDQARKNHREIKRNGMGTI